MKILVAAIIGLFATQAVLANGSVTAHVIKVRIDQSGNGVVYFDWSSQDLVEGIR